VIPAADGSYDELWVVVQRYLNGRTVRTIEFLTDVWEQGQAQENVFFADCGLTYDGAPATTITGLFHLAGETVQVLVDGATHPDVMVSATGSITLNAAASVVHVGYAYESDGQCLRFDAGSATGTAQGKMQRQVGPDFDHLTELTFRTAADLMNQPVPLFTGDKDDFTWDGDYSTEAYICWRWSGLLPGTILAVMPELVTQDRL
jgi:hypothetical protein